MTSSNCCSLVLWNKYSLDYLILSMELDTLPTIPHAHQQIRLGDAQALGHKWTTAIEYYLRAIEYFKAIQNTLSDHSLIPIIQSQIIQCEKTIHLCRLKDRSEQAMKEQQAERLSKLTRAYSTSHLRSPGKSNRMLARHNTFQIDNSSLLDAPDSLSTLIFAKTNDTSPKRTRVIAKKNKKHDSQKIEELQMSYEALKTHLKAAFDDIERLKCENNQLRVQKDGQTIEEHNEARFLANTDDDEPENELVATL